MGYERHRVFVYGTSKKAQALACRPRDPSVQLSSHEASSSSFSTADSDLPRFDVNPETRTQFVASFIDCFSPSAVIRDGKGSAVMHLQDTFPSFVGSSAVMDKAVTALSVAFLAKAKLDSDMLVYSTRLTEIPPSLGLGLERLAAGPAIVPACRMMQRVFWLLPSVSSRLLCSMAYIGHLLSSSSCPLEVSLDRD
jgi:hypothetical protein